MAKKSVKLPVSKLPVTISHSGGIETASPNKTDEAHERKWKAEDALRDLERAKAHEGDKQLMSDVKKLAAEKIKSLKGI